ncbi:hypothetical protein [Thiococcus pfennigii]|uniref:hypothetical protein n=1 Tax=Thiococcus pfennigii TaxID=1057 RepID=UPI00190636D4|nr:hypothetical protein [Thiococcus pfennigii]MBK1699992.1 hypothetical protein [Thiococcus pfennigii]
MDRRAALVVFGLAVIAALYLVGLGLGLRVNANGGSIDLNEATAGWLAKGMGWLQRLAPRLDLEGLVCDDEGAQQPVTDGVRLAVTGPGAASCDIRIPTGFADEMRRAELRAEGGQPTLYVLANLPKEHFPSDPRRAASGQAPCYAPEAGGHPAPPDLLRVEVRFRPASAPSGDTWPPCLRRLEPSEALPITVQSSEKRDDYATLTLRLRCQPCPPNVACACREGRRNAAHLRME